MTLKDTIISHCWLQLHCVLDVFRKYL